MCKCDKLATLDLSRPKGKWQNWLPLRFQTLQGVVSSCTNGQNPQPFLGDGGAFQSRFMDVFLLNAHIFSFLLAEIQHYSSMPRARGLQFCIRIVLDFICWTAPKLLFLWASYFSKNRFPRQKYSQCCYMAPVGRSILLETRFKIQNQCPRACYVIRQVRGRCRIRTHAH